MDGSGFLHLNNPAAIRLVELDADIDDVNNAVFQGLLRARSSGTGGRRRSAGA